MAESPAWKLNRERLRIAERERIDPKAVKLDERAVNAAGGGSRRQRQAAREEENRFTDELDASTRELSQRIGEYLKGHPHASPKEVARSVGCTAHDVECWQAAVNRLAQSQADSQLEDTDVPDPNARRGKRRGWVPKKV